MTNPFTYLSTHLSTYLPTPTYLPLSSIYLPTYLLIYLPLPTYLSRVFYCDLIFLMTVTRYRPPLSPPPHHLPLDPLKNDHYDMF